MTQGRTFDVAVFSHPGKRGPRYQAYTLWYSPTWPGCCMHKVHAANGDAAKRKAIADHKDKCLEPRS